MHRTPTVLQRAYDEVPGLLPPPLPAEEVESAESFEVVMKAF